VAYVPQGTPLIDELTAWDNLRLWYDRAALEASLEGGMLRQLGVGDFLKTPAGKLSGGMRKRLSIGCAMSGQPEILLLDEPTAALDLVCKQALMDTFALFRQQGGLILIATHDLLELGSCDRVMLLSKGSLTPYDFDGDARRLAQVLEKA
jgi:ABC-2 type transport system ATP-binding protein